MELTAESHFKELFVEKSDVRIVSGYLLVLRHCFMSSVCLESIYLLIKVIIYFFAVPTSLSALSASIHVISSFFFFFFSIEATVCAEGIWP